LAAATSDCSSGSTRTTSAPGSCELIQANNFPAILKHGFPYEVVSSASGSRRAMRRTSIQLAIRGPAKILWCLLCSHHRGQKRRGFHDWFAERLPRDRPALPSGLERRRHEDGSSRATRRAARLRLRDRLLGNAPQAPFASPD